VLSERRVDVKYSFTEKCENSITCESPTLTMESRLAACRQHGLPRISGPPVLQERGNCSCVEIERRRTLQAPPHGVGGKPPRHIQRYGEHIPSFAHRYLATCVHMFHRVSRVIHLEHAGYELGCNAGGKRADRKPIGTYRKHMRKSRKGSQY
jgi:hypothetical protein